MTYKLITIGAALGTTLSLAVSSAWGASAPSRDAGDASGARLGVTTSAQIVRDAGDATAARLLLQSRKAPPVTVVRDAGDATAAKNGLLGASEHNRSQAQVVRDAGDATAARLALKSGSILGARRSGTVRTQHELALRAALASLAARTVTSRRRSLDSQDTEAVGAPVPVGTPAAVGSADNGFSWRDAGIGAGAGLLAIVVIASAFLGIRHTRRRVVSPA